MRVPRKAAAGWGEGKAAPRSKSLRMDIMEIKRTLDGAVHTFPCTAAEVTPHRAVLLYTISQGRRVADVELPAQTVTVAYYWTDRPYNVYHWVAPSSETLAWYFNASGPVQIGDGRVEWEDLELDVLVTPDLRVRVLDEDRLPADLPAARHLEIARARRRILDEQAPVTHEVEVASRGFLARRARERR
jgi:uncharacterized protein